MKTYDSNEYWIVSLFWQYAHTHFWYRVRQHALMREYHIINIDNICTVNHAYVKHAVELRTSALSFRLLILPFHKSTSASYRHNPNNSTSSNTFFNLDKDVFKFACASFKRSQVNIKITEKWRKNDVTEFFFVNSKLFFSSAIHFVKLTTSTVPGRSITDGHSIFRALPPAVKFALYVN